MTKKPKWKPYLMRGAPVPSKKRATSVDRPDGRVPEVRPRPLTPKDLRGRRSPFGTDPRVRAVDLQFIRWAAAPIGDIGYPGMAEVELRQEPEFGGVPLDNAETMIIDAAIKASPPWASRFVLMWYKQRLLPQEIADALAMKRREYVYDERERVLFYWFGRLTEIGFSLTVEPWEA